MDEIVQQLRDAHTRYQDAFRREVDHFKAYRRAETERSAARDEFSALQVKLVEAAVPEGSPTMFWKSAMSQAEEELALEGKTEKKS